jgi:hypothetical protein
LSDSGYASGVVSLLLDQAAEDADLDRVGVHAGELRARVAKLKGTHTLKATFFLGGVEQASSSVAFTAK